MNIGIDIDNVISNFNESLLNEFLIHHQNMGYDENNIDKKAGYITQGMFKWPAGEVKSFYHDNIERIVRHLEVKEGAKEYIDKLKENGHKIYIITGRANDDHSDPYNTTLKWLEDNNIYYDKLILTNSYEQDNHGKSKECLKHNIEIMIDDSIHICKDCFDYGITALLMDTTYNRYETKITRVNNWQEIYNFIENYQRSKIKVILDTDTYNECDDQFALSYMLKSQDIFNIEAITIAPYSHNNLTRKANIIEGQENSYNEALKICNWLSFNTENKIFKGSIDYIRNGYNENNEAVNKIINVALKNDKTYIMAIGAITNVALAIKKNPSILSKIEVIWLGGNELGYKDNLEYNFRQDIEAVKIVFDSKVKLTIIPCNEIASILRTDIATLNYHLKDKSDLCSYLINRFYNDGYHGVQKSRIIWDISVIAYMINKKWFKTKEVSCPTINDDGSYEITNDNHLITMVSHVDRKKIYADLFRKLGAVR